MSDNFSVRATASAATQSDRYIKHVGIYLNYYRGLDGQTSRFLRGIPKEEFDRLEEQTRDEYRTLHEALFGPQLVDGPSILRFVNYPNEYFTNEVAGRLEVRGDLTFEAFFESLKLLLPPTSGYRTKFVVDPSIPGGFFDQREDAIKFGEHTPNVSTVMGLGHEFGHSVYELGRENREISDANVLHDMAMNEGYADLWAYKIMMMGLLGSIFVHDDHRDALAVYIRFHDLMRLRFGLYRHEMEELALSGTSTDDYFERQAEAGKRYLLIDDMPPIIPILPQSRLPGYNQANLWARFVVDNCWGYHEDDDFTSNMLLLAGDLRSNYSVGHYESLLGEFKRRYPVGPQTFAAAGTS